MEPQKKPMSLEVNGELLEKARELGVDLGVQRWAAGILMPQFTVYQNKNLQSRSAIP